MTWRKLEPESPADRPVAHNDHARSNGAALLTATMVVATLLIAPATPAAAQEPALDQLSDFREVVRDAKASVFPAVVYVRTVRESHESGRQIAQEVSGSGVVISAEGEVVTNWHVVDRARTVRCLLSDGRHFDADIVGSDKATDIALLRLRIAPGEAPPPFAGFADSNALAEGDFVMAMGAPWGLNRSVSIGIISCTRRHLPESSEYSHWLQTDAAINPGNSGGPLVNTDGLVVGINTLGMMVGDGVGFAVPSEIVQIVINQLRDYGQVNWSWFGLQLQPLRDFNRNQYFEGTRGVIVAETDPESPARSAGIQPRDRIMSINGIAIDGVTEEDLSGIRRRLALLPMHEPAAFIIERDGQTIEIDVAPREKGSVEGGELDCPRWDLTVKEINQFDNPDLFFHRREGVFIFGTKYPGNASSSGLRPNDIITRIDGRDVLTLDEVKAIHAEALENIESSHRMVFVVLRGGLPRQIVLDYARDHSKR